MALPPFLSTLPKAARLFYPIAVKGVSQGLAANTILKAYTAAGPGIRRTLGLEVVRAVRGVERSASVFKALGLDRRPSIAKIPTALHKTWRKFSYLVEFEGLTTEGKSVRAAVTVASDSIITRRQAEAQAGGWLADTPAEYGIETIEKIQLAGIKKSPLLG